MATTVAAYGKVKAMAARGEAIPEGWMVDREGKPLTDPARAAEGFLLPIGGYKGYGLALVVGLLAGTLNGAAMGRELIDFNQDAKSETNTGQAIVAIDPAAFGEVAPFKAAVDPRPARLRAHAGRRSHPHAGGTKPREDRAPAPGGHRAGARRHAIARPNRTRPGHTAAAHQLAGGRRCSDASRPLFSPHCRSSRSPSRTPASRSA
jgi:hypothetical protein